MELQMNSYNLNNESSHIDEILMKLMFPLPTSLNMNAHYGNVVLKHNYKLEKI